MALVSWRQRQLANEALNSDLSSRIAVKTARIANAKYPKSATGHAECVFQAIDQPFYSVALTIAVAVEVLLLRFVRPTRNHRLNTSSLQVPPHLAATVAFVTDHPVRAQPWPSASRPLDRSLLHEGRERTLLMALARCQEDGDRLAPSFGAQVELRAEAALAASERLLLLPPLARRAPAACWCARTTVPST
jgi:hypothetical protein